jgi:hypothetical protein
VTAYQVLSISPLLCALHQVQAQTLGSKRDRATFLMLNKPGAGVFEVALLGLPY